MNNLRKEDKPWIRICKNVDNPNDIPLMDRLKTEFEFRYGWNPEMDLYSFHQIMFERLLEIWEVFGDIHAKKQDLRSIFSCILNIKDGRTSCEIGILAIANRIAFTPCELINLKD